MIAQMPAKNAKSNPASANKYFSKVTALKSFRPNKPFYVALAVIGILALAVYQKSWFVAAMVNGQPISNLALQQRLNQQFRDQTLTQMINEKIITDEARKKGVRVTPQEINDRISQLEKNVGGAQALDGLLSNQGQSRADLKTQLYIQLAIEKLYDSEASVSAEELAKFIEQNKNQLQSTSPAEQSIEATDIIKQQKLGTIFRSKFAALRQNAKIQTF